MLVRVRDVHLDHPTTIGAGHQINDRCRGSTAASRNAAGGHAEAPATGSGEGRGAREGQDLRRLATAATNETGFVTAAMNDWVWDLEKIRRRIGDFVLVPFLH